MASLREGIEAEDATKQATALLQVLNLLAGGREVGSAVSAACQSVLARPANGPSKRLAYDIAKTAALSSDDWDAVYDGLRTDVAGAHSPEVQCSALEVLPLAPPNKIFKLLAEADLAKHVTACMQSSLPEVRAAGVAAVGQLLSNADLLALLAPAPAAAAAANQWTAGLGNALMDPIAGVCAASHVAVQRLLSNVTQRHGTDAEILSEQLAGVICQRVVKSLGTILEQGQMLSAAEQVLVVPSLVAVVQFGQQKLWSFAVAPSADDLSAGSFSTGSTAVIPGHQGSWVAEQVGDFLASILDSSDPSVSFQAAQGLLQLTRTLSSGGNSGGLRAVAGVASSWGALAVAALLQLWDRQLSFAGHAQLMSVITDHLDCLQVPSQLSVIKEIMPLTTLLSSAAGRCTAMARIWHAVVQLDLATRRAVRSGDKAVPGAQLKNVLTEPFVMGIISGSFAGSGPVAAAVTKNPGFKEELTATLIQTLRQHPRASLSVPQGVADHRHNSQDIAAVTESAAFSQCIAELTDWLGSAKIALQGTKACLGWDREPQGGCHACTAVVDLWLQLLQRALHLSGKLPHTAQGLPKQGSLGEGLDPAVDMQGQVGQLVASYRASLQELMTQLLVHWKVLSSAVKPRALWVAAHHLQLSGRMDGLWGALLNAVADLVSGNEADYDTRRAKAGQSAAAEGKLAPASNNPFSGHDASLGAPPPNPSQEAVDEGDIEAEGVESALISLERVTAVLTLNSQQGISPGMKDIAAKIGDVLKPYSKGSRVGLDTRDRLQRVLKQTGPIATVDLRPLSTQGGEDGSAPAEPPVREDPLKLKLSTSWQVNEGYPMAAPTSVVLQATKRASRYWPLYSQVQTAVTASYSGGLPKAAGTDSLADLNSMPGIAEVMSLVTDLAVGEEAGREELTGPTDPVRVVISHTLKPAARSVSFAVEVLNRMTADVKGLVIRLSLGGPLVSESKQAAMYRIPIIPAGDKVILHLRCHIRACAHLSLQPFVSLPVNIPGEDLSLRCRAYSIAPSALLGTPSLTPSPADFFHQLAAMPYGCHMCGMCSLPGWQGGLALLSNLERSPLNRVLLRGLPAQGGFEAAYRGAFWDNKAVALVITGQLLPTSPTTPVQLDASTTNGSQVQSRVACRVTVKSTSSELMLSIENSRGAWLSEVTKGALIDGLIGQITHLANASSHIHAAVAPLKAAYLVAKSNSLEDAGLASGDSTPPSVFEDVLAQEWRRLQAVIA